MRFILSLCVILTMGSLVFAGPEGRPLEKQSFTDVLKGKSGDLMEKPYKETYPLVKGLDAAGWFTVDIAPGANRSSIDPDMRGRGWIGKGPEADMRRLESGKHTWYGVPFTVLDPKGGKANNCIAMASRHIPITEAPEKVSISVGRKARVLYFLHACAWSTMAHNFEYVATYDDGTKESLPVNPAGVLRGQYENIHDWLSEDLIETPASRYVILPRDKTPEGMLDTRVLYILEWELKNPGKVIKSLEFSGSAKNESTILVLAVTGHE